MTDAPRKHKIVFVPGKNPKPPPDVHRTLLWRCLVHGVECVDPATAQALAAQSDVFELVSWNALFYQAVKAADEDEPWIRRLLAADGPHERDIRDARTWRTRLAQLLYLIADHLQFLIPLLPDPAVRSAVLEAGRYFHNTGGIAATVRDLLKEPLRQMFAAGDRVLLIAHSMGAIIAYDALWELSQMEHNPGRVDLFVTIGSPLGMHYVQRHLLGYPDREPSYPSNIRRWINIAARGDLTALDPRVQHHYREMLARGVIDSITDVHAGVFNYFRNDKGLNVHRSYGYLVEPHLARVVAEWWRDAVTNRPVLAASRGMA